MLDQLLKEIAMGPKTRSATDAEQKESGDATKDTTKQEKKRDMLNNRRIKLEYLEFIAQQLQTAVNEQHIHTERTKKMREMLKKKFPDIYGHSNRSDFSLP